MYVMGCTMMDVVAAPKDEDAQVALRLQIKKILAEDEKLADEVSRLWDDAIPGKMLPEHERH
jgi:hypothetical protein